MIDLIPNREQQEIADAIAVFLAETLPVERHRSDAGRRGANEAAPEVWAQLAELGCFGLSLEEKFGGIGLTLAEETLAFREYGRYLVSPAMLGTVLAAKVAAQAGQVSLAQDLAAGRRRAGLGNPLGANAPAGRLQLFDVRQEDLAVVWDDQGARLYEAADLGPTRRLACLDHTLSLDVVDTGNARPCASAAGEALSRIAALLVAASLCGTLEAICAMAVTQAQTRIQFGQPIGTFQAVKHKCADIGLACELSWSETVYAALTQVEATADAPFHAWNARLIAGTAAMDAARTNVQLHGGMGFTAEVNAHLFLKRVHVLNEIGGNLRSQQAKLLNLPAAA